MIRSFNKPLLKEWVIVQASKPIPHRNYSRFSSYRRSVVFASSQSLSRGLLFTFLPPARSPHVRYSTSSDEAKVKTKDVPPPSTSIPSLKPKADFRPAPKTLKQETRSPTTQAPRTARHNVQEDAAASSSTTFSKPTTSASESPQGGLLQTTQADILDATKKGILSAPPEGASALGRFWHNLVQMFYFYSRGVKLIFVTHRKQASAIRRRVQEARAQGGTTAMTRSETRFVQTYRRDLVKLLPFLLTILILEEALPLVILYLPGFLPSTCLLPRQRERIEGKRREKQLAHLAIAKLELERLHRHHQFDTSVKEMGLVALSEELTRAVSGILGRATWGPIFLQRYRIARYLAYLSADDALLVKEDMGTGLKREELVEALEERGFGVSSATPQYMLQMLQWWLKGARDDKTRIDLVLQVARSAK